MRATLLAIALAAAAWSIGAAAADAQVERIAAVVNDKVISVYDLRQRIDLLILTAGLPNTAEQRQRMAPQVLRGLIDEALQMEEAARLNIRVTQRDLDEAIRQIEQVNDIPDGRFDDFIRQRGLPPEAALSQIRTSIAWQKLLARRVVPTIEIGEEEIDAVIDRIRSGSGKTQYHIAEIVLPVDDPAQQQAVRDLASRLVNRIRQGADFAAIARQFSKSATAATSGDVGWMLEGELSEEINRVLGQLEVGEVSRPVATPDSLMIIKLVDRRTSVAPGRDDRRVALRQLVIPLPSGSTSDDIGIQQALAREVATTTTGCADFAQIAKELGTPQPAEPAAFRLGDLNERLRAIAAEIPIDQASEPVRTPAGIQLVMVCEREEEAGLPRDQIRNRLLQQRVDMLARRYLRDLHRAAFIDLRV